MQFNKGELASYPLTLSLQMQHATRANSDVAVTLEHGIGDRYIGHISQPLSKGIWYFELSDADWKLESRVSVADNNTIQLQSRY